MEHENRVDELEIRYAQLERTVQELSDVVYAQQKQLDALVSGMQKMMTKLKAEEPGVVDAGVQERPPHY